MATEPRTSDEVQAVWALVAMCFCGGALAVLLIVAILFGSKS